jgi:hypothetical protein
MGFWISTDIGSTWRWVNTSQHYSNKISFHPYSPQTFLTVGKPSSCYQNPVVTCYTEAMVTKDDGITWETIITKYRQGNN